MKSVSVDEGQAGFFYPEQAKAKAWGLVRLLDFKRLGTAPSAGDMQ